MGKSWKTYGQQHQIQSIAVELSVINQSTRACEMEDSWRVQYRQSERTALSKTIIWCIIHTVSMVSLLPPSLSPSLYVSVCLSPLSLALDSYPVSCGGCDEAQLSSSHTAPQLLGDYTFQWCILTRCHSNRPVQCVSPATKAPQTAPLVKMQLVLIDNYGQFSTKGCHFGALLILRNFPGRSRT